MTVVSVGDDFRVTVASHRSLARRQDLAHGGLHGDVIEEIDWSVGRS